MSLFVFFYICCFSCFFFFKQKTAYEMRISDWSSDVCSSDLQFVGRSRPLFPSRARAAPHLVELSLARLDQERSRPPPRSYVGDARGRRQGRGAPRLRGLPELAQAVRPCADHDRVYRMNIGRASWRERVCKYV